MKHWLKQSYQGYPGNRDVREETEITLVGRHRNQDNKRGKR